MSDALASKVVSKHPIIAPCATITSNELNAQNVKLPDLPPVFKSPIAKQAKTYDLDMYHTQLLPFDDDNDDDILIKFLETSENFQTNPPTNPTTNQSTPTATNNNMTLTTNVQNVQNVAPSYLPNMLPKCFSLTPVLPSIIISNRQK